MPSLGHFAQSSSASRLTASASKFFILARSVDRADPIARCSAIRAAISKLQVSQMRTRPSPTAPGPDRLRDGKRDQAKPWLLGKKCHSRRLEGQGHSSETALLRSWLQARGLALKRTQGQTNTRHYRIPSTLFFLRIGEIKAVDRAEGTARKIAAAVKNNSISLRGYGEERPGYPHIVQRSPVHTQIVPQVSCWVLSLIVRARVNDRAARPSERSNR